MQKKGQIAIFVILAIVIVSAVISIYSFRDKLTFVSGEDINPNTFLKSCIQPEAEKAIGLLSRQGGYSNPEGFVLYQDEKIKYLCYSSQNYKSCTVQQPMIKEHFESELRSILLPKAKQCLSNLETEYEKRNFDVNSGDVELNVSITLNAIGIDFIAPMTITKSGETRSFDGFKINIESKMYEILAIAKTIIEFEAVFGSSDINTLSLYYRDDRIEKNELGDGTTIYKITNIITDESFRFASRSIVWPPGYGIG